MGKFSCLGIPAALFLLATDVSSMTDGNMITMDLLRTSTMSLTPLVDGNRGNHSRLSIKKAKRFAGKWLKWISAIVILLIVGLFLGIFLFRHSSNTRPAVPDVGTSTDITSNAKFPIATTTSATGCYGGSEAYLDSTVEQQMEIFVSSERDKHAEIILKEKKGFLKRCIDFWSTTDGLEESSRNVFHRHLNRRIQEHSTRAAGELTKRFRKLAPNRLKAEAEKWATCMMPTIEVESWKELIDGWVKAGSEALEVFNKETDHTIEQARRKLKDFLGDEGFNKAFEVHMNDWDETMIPLLEHKIEALNYLPNKKAQALSYVAKEIREELSKSKSLEGAGSMPSIDEMLRKKFEEPIIGEIERTIEWFEEKLLREIQDLLVVLKKVEVINGKIKLPKSNVNRIKKSMMELAKLEKKNN